MTKKSFLIILLFLIAIPFQLSYLYLFKNQDKSSVAGLKTESFSINNSLFIGEFRFTLFGYTSPNAVVSLNGQGINDQTISDSTGYFEFANRFSPFSPSEACLSAKDQFGRISSPVCLPPLPTETNITIGPVIIPPTLSLDKNSYFTGDEVILSGQTIPDSKVNLSIFTRPTNLLSKSIIKPVEAFSIPKLTATSDSLGNFSIALPSSSAQNYRLFAQVDYQDLPSANSLTLSLKIQPIWMIIIKFFGFLWNIIKDRLLELIILLEIIALISYYLKILIDYHTKYAIVLRNKYPLTYQLTRTDLVKKSNEQSALDVYHLSLSR